MNFGHINIPRALEYPKPQKIGALNGVHGVSSDSIVVVDAQTLLIPSFSYDGEAPGKVTYKYTLLFINFVFSSSILFGSDNVRHVLTSHLTLLRVDEV